MSTAVAAPSQENEHAPTYPIAEIFESPQGEGAYAGTLMTFIRFAGCTVGKPYLLAERQTLGLSVYQERCTSWDGESFACDTNYRMAGRYTPDALLSHIDVAGAKRVCLTGGEPLMHSLSPFIEQLIDRGKAVHIETSGTIPVSGPLLRSELLYIAVSPKKNYLPSMIALADELKILVDRKSFDGERFYSEFGSYLDKVFIQPINGENEINWENLELCLDLQKKYKQVRLSLQMHKILKVR